MHSTVLDMTSAPLFRPIQLGRIKLANRIVMAPMTRNRAEEQNLPSILASEYYSQRASLGLLIAEATQVSETAQGYSATPGLHSEEQIAAWKCVTDEVHKKGGKIFIQLWHTGRISVRDFQPHNQAPIAPSAIRAKAHSYVIGKGYVDTDQPRALAVKEIDGVIEDFRMASSNAIRAGFDGVELHAAHGYLVDAFLRDGSNQRTDRYGGSIENRARFLLEITNAMIEEVGADRVGVRISPVSPVNDSYDSNPQVLFEYVVTELEKLSPVYIHMVEGITGGPRDSTSFDYDSLKKKYSGVWILNNGYTREMAIKAIEEGAADLISFGRATLSNPDLPRRFQENAPLNECFSDVPLYGGIGPHGYVDYPTLESKG